MADIEISDDLQAEIVKSVTEGLNFEEKMKEVSEASAKAAAEAVVAALDKPNKKSIEADEEAGAKKIEDLSKAEFERFEKMSPQRRFFAAAKALAEGNRDEVIAYNRFSAAKMADAAVSTGLIDAVEKAGYANINTNADGKVIVPDPDFNTQVYNNLPKYGVAFSDANVLTTDRNAVYALSLTGTVAFTSTAEAVAISGQKLVFDRKLTSLIKYAAIVPATEELTQDAIINYWELVTNEVARAYSKIADQITFTDSSMGIVKTTGIITQPVTSTGTSITWDDLLKAEGALEDGIDTSNFKWYMRKETFYRLAQLKASTSGVYLADTMLAGWNPNPNSPVTPWGTPIKFTRVLNRSVDAATNDHIAVFGDLKNYNLYQKNGLEMKMLSEATITDASGSSFNLATQDGYAMRVIVRLLGILPTGNAPKFVVVGTGTVS